MLLILNKENLTRLLVFKTQMSLNMQMLYQSTKKKDKSDKTNYPPVSILPNVSKIYEKVIYNQRHEYFHNKLLSNQCGFRKDIVLNTVF